MLTLLDVFLLLPVIAAALVLKLVRRLGVWRLPLSVGVMRRIGVFPIRNHYYEPYFGADGGKSLNSFERKLPGIDWNDSEQVVLLKQLSYSSEIRDLPIHKPPKPAEYYFENPSFGPGDADYLYNMVRLRKPRRLIEIGSGFSTIIAAKAIARNAAEDASYTCQHICIEPYEIPWLELLPVTVVRKNVESVDRSMFRSLEAGDFLFIDSSHMVRPGGDVLFEYLEVLPILQQGVIVHIHDIFSPDDYPRNWILGEAKFWNEQYLLEAFLSCNPAWKIIGGLSYLRTRHFELLAQKCVRLTADKRPASFYMERI